MQTRTMLLAAAAAVAVLATAGIGLAETRGGSDDAATSAPTPSTTTSPDRDMRVDASGEDRAVAAGPAGAVGYRVTDALAITSVEPAPGWTAEVERPQGVEIEVVFTNGVRRIDVEVETEDGAPRERVRERTDDRSSVDADDGGSDDDDRNLDTRDDDDDDRSGRRDGHDDHRADDDDDDGLGSDHHDD